MAFSEDQVKQLSGKLSGKHVKTRVKNGFMLSYIEGWHAISEANRIFWFDAWDRETVTAECIWERTQGRHNACSYVARVRITVRSGDTVICREGSGSGNVTGKNPGEAHERALKEAETDAMKRAMTTFGNLFGLALYDKAQNGVRQCRSTSNKKQVKWTIISETGEPKDSYEDPVIFCSKIRERLEAINEAETLMAFWARNKGAVEGLWKNLPDLTSEKGRHFGELLEGIYKSCLEKIKQRIDTKSSDADQKSLQAKEKDQCTDKSVDQKIDPFNGTLSDVNSDDTLIIKKRAHDGSGTEIISSS